MLYLKGNASLSLSLLDQEPTTKQYNATLNAISNFFSFSNPFLEDHETDKRFFVDIMLFVIKGFLPLKVVEFFWFHIIFFNCAQG